MASPTASATATTPLRDRIVRIYTLEGPKAYGLYGINQLQHALQSAARAEDQDMSPAMVIACLVHDIGHMAHNLGEAPAEEGIDDKHELLGARWIETAGLSRDVSEPVRLHVLAKRYLCTAEEGYVQMLGKDSQISLQLQGGLMTADEIETFLNHPYADDAIALRRIDELAKDRDAQTPPIEAYLDRWLDLSRAP
jgi:predicted HD phosphohydrolase